MTLKFNEEFAINPQSVESGGGGGLAPNMEKVGNPQTKKELLMFGFSTSNYGHKTINSLGNNAWELECEFTTGSELPEGQETIGISTKGASPFYFIRDGICLFLSSDGENWDIAGDNTGGGKYLTATTNTTYRMKITYDKSKYVVSRLVDGSWQVLKTVNSTTPIYSDTNLWIGINQRGGAKFPFVGTLNLSKCTLKVNGETVWQGVTVQ